MSENSHQTTVVAMSGGVDSSTAAALLAERHPQPGAVVGLTMQLWDQRRLAPSQFSPEASAPGSSPAAPAAGTLDVVHAGRCCSLDDAYDARRVAAHLGLPFYVVNFEQQFEQAVVGRFVASYLAGQTPIPCTLCNNHIKFDVLLTTARQIGADRLATGHYARIRFNPAAGRYELWRATDAAKDQSYFLFGLTQEQLAAIEFPLGDLTKQQVRALARARGLPVAEKPESQELCFVPAGHYVRFLEAYLAEQGRDLPRTPGDIVTTDGRLLGQHFGLHQFTIGQRRGLGLAVGQPLYVVALDPAANRVVVGDEQALYRREAVVTELNWVSIPALADPLHCTVKVRHKHQPAAATLYPADAHSLRVVFDLPQRALTPGQAAVFYDGACLLGGGWLS